MVEGRHGDDGVERPRLESDVEHVTLHPFDAATLVARPRSIEHGSIDIEADNTPHAGVNEVGCQHAVAAPDIKDTRHVRRE